jgi:hypothetical protein
MKTYNGRPVIVSAGPGTKMPELYRARVFQSGDRLEEALAYPDRHLGPPPPAAAIAGRMNARGISVFYGATDPMVALAEVRPPVGSSVVVARFEVFRPLKLLDLIAMRDVAAHGSVFDAGFKRRREHSVFLGNLSDRIVRPVMPDDEPFEYLATQAIADFLATENAPALDGIIYPSVQAASNEARNVVLFHKAAIVEPMDLPENLEISVSSGHWSAEGWEADYSVLEEDRTGKEPRDHRSGLRGYYRGGRFGRADSERVIGWPAVRVDLQKINVHIVARVQFKTEDFKVSRSRHDRSEIPF